MKKFTYIAENNNFIDINRIQLDSELLFITENNKQIGSLIMTFNNKTASIFSVAILENWRGKGYSKKLVNSAINRAKQRNCILIELNTEIDNTIANNLYKSLGFKFQGIVDGYNNYQFIL